MKIENRDKSTFQKKQVSQQYTNNKAKYNFDLELLNTMCSFILSSNLNIKRVHMSNMKLLFENIDMTVYQNEPEKLKRIHFINKGLEARLYRDLRQPVLILAYINDGIAGTDLDLSKFRELSNTELEYVNECVSGALKGLFVETDMDRFYELYMRYKALDYREKASMQGEIETFFSQVHAKFRKAQTESMFEQNFSLEEGVFEANVSDIYDTITAPGRFIGCGMQGLNMLVGGAFEATRVYVLFGIGGVGKSIVMLNIALQMKRHNKGYKTKDPTKKPAILFLTQENSVEETVERLFKIIKNDKIRNYSKQEVIEILKNEGKLAVDEYDNVNLIITYRPDSSIDTNDLYNMVEDYEDRGYEIIALFQDHIKRIKSANKIVDKRLELGAVTNELKAIAQAKGFPVITVSHLNREAVRKVDGANDNGQGGNPAALDISKALNRADIGESLLIYDNADSVIFLNKAYDMDKVPYMAFTGYKLRNELVPLNFFYQPYTSPDSIELVDDVDSMYPAYLTTLIPEKFISPNKRTDSITGIDKKIAIKPTTIEDLEASGPILSGKRYSLNDMVEEVVEEKKPTISLNCSGTSSIAIKPTLAEPTEEEVQTFVSFVASALNQTSKKPFVIFGQQKQGIA